MFMDILLIMHVVELSTNSTSTSGRELVALYTTFPCSVGLRCMLVGLNKEHSILAH